MDMAKMGAFLRELRKEKGLTQEQLGEKIHVTGKTVSRWETGTYMPPVEMLLALSELYGVSMNEIVSGRRLSPSEQAQKAEENLTGLMKENEIFQKQERKAFWQNKWNRDQRGNLVCIAILLLAAYILGLVAKLEWLKTGAVLAAVAVSLILTNRRAAYVEHHLYDEQ